MAAFGIPPGAFPGAGGPPQGGPPQGGPPPGFGAGAPSPGGGLPPSLQLLAQQMRRIQLQAQGNAVAEDQLQKAMTMIGVLMQSLMDKEPDAYQALLRGQTSLHAALTKLRSKRAGSAPLNSSMLLPNAGGSAPRFSY